MYRKLAVMYEGERVLGEVELHPQDGAVWVQELEEIRISHYSPPSERCPPLAVLHSMNSTEVCFKLESTAKSQDSPLSFLHANCLRHKKTAVACIGGGEIHLVAMHSRKYEVPSACFWGFKITSNLFKSCLVMLNQRCLGIVFDLDETLIVANTMRSFEDRIEALQRRIKSESDPQRVSGMLAEVKRYQDDRNILKQYAENDQVIDNGKVIKSQSEVFPALSETHQPIVRPLIRLQDRNIILTRINPLIRDTSVLVRLRPAWEDLRSYLIARGRKRFEVFVCTMAERDYALEMWRLLDPGSNLIDSRELLDRIVCVKSGCRKSLFNVFQDGNCHPKMALVIDDRLKVWDENDQPRVHVVPAFAPYYAPQAEENNTVPVLCVARNVACNVRSSFFKEFDDGLLLRISEVAYEDDIKDVSSSPDVSNYLIPEVYPRIAPALHYMAPSSSFTVSPPTIQGPAMSFPSQQSPQVTKPSKPPFAQLGQAETTVHSSPATEEGEVPESELDPDTRRRLLILQHGQDFREPPPSESLFPARPPMPASVTKVQPHGWFPVEEEMSPGQLNRVASSQEFPMTAESLPIDKNQAHYPPFLQKVEPSIPPGRVLLESSRLREALPREGQLRLNQSLPDFHSFSGEDGSVAQPYSENKDPDLEAGQIDPSTETCVGALEYIAFKCGAKVEFKPALVSSTDLQFLVEVLFAGQRIGDGLGRTRREAQRQAAEGSLLYLADKYLAQIRPDSSSVPGDGSRFANQRDNGFISDTISFGRQSLRGESVPFSTDAPPPRVLDPRIEPFKKQMGPIAALRELCMMEGLGVAFQTQPQLSANLAQKNEVYAQVEVNGQIIGKGIGLTWEEAKSEAAERALGALKSMVGQFPYRHQDSPRSMQVTPNKRIKQDFSHVPQRIPSSDRYCKGGSPVP
ncbi:Phosphoprotein phosphatase [Handroanthus impetiginosus]|uniref:protein-serine/threonine phosphatase n=1 Tax=Handroanthus impetiginosus TaxID=429701 RepID=A0A2G9HFK2_9LAMI|nr:Phosphoprotein phosphatase [Handroanthus impetiginosus]